MAASVYDFLKNSVIVNGHFVTGWMDGTVITAAKNADNVIPHVGAGGEVSFSESNDKTGTITLTIKQNSASLPVLMALANGKKEFPTSLVDTNTNSLKAGGNSCRILKTADVGWGTEVAGVEFAIYVSDYSMTAS